MQQGVHEHKSSPEARPVGRAVKSITCSGRDEWLFASLCRAKQAIRNRQKGKYVSFKVIRHSEVSDAVRHVRPYSILDQSGTRKSGRSVGVPEFYSRVKQRSTLVRIKRRRQQEVFSLLGVFRDRLASLGWAAATPRFAQSRRVRSRPSAHSANSSPWRVEQTIQMLSKLHWQKRTNRKSQQSFEGHSLSPQPSPGTYTSLSVCLLLYTDTKDGATRG